jgi:SAM-dependent methyltransferase
VKDSVAASSAGCPVCDSGKHEPVLHVDGVPVFCNVLWPSKEEASNVAKGDIKLHFCPTCGHMFNAAFDPVLMDYTQAYETSLHYSPRFQAYARSLARKLVERHNLYEKDVIEIGCGKGDFLRLLCETGDNRGVGFDPSYDEARNGIAGDGGRFEVIRDLYTDKYADYSADLIACRHVLEHVDEPRVMLETVVIYEHCGYFSESSLSYLFAACGLTPINVTEGFGGQYLCLEAVPEGDPELPQSPSRQRQVEVLGVYVRRFSELYSQTLGRWEERLARLCEDDRTVVVWGAGSKGVTFLNTIRSAICIEYVVDINPHKQGLHVPGTGQEVVAPDFLETCVPDVILLTNPLYSEEIRRTAAEMKLGAEILEV